MIVINKRTLERSKRIESRDQVMLTYVLIRLYTGRFNSVFNSKKVIEENCRTLKEDILILFCSIQNV